MRVAIAGAGQVGTHIAGDLKASGHEVLLIEQNHDLVSRLRPTIDVEWLVADACEVSSLQEAHLETADVVVAATGDDEDNLVISLLAKQEFAVPRVVARVNHPKNEWLFDEAWGVDVAVSTPRMLSALVEEAVAVGDLVRLFTFGEGNANLVEFTLTPGAALEGVAVGQVGWPPDTALVAIVRDTHVITPTSDEPLEVGDELMFVTTQEQEHALQVLLGAVRDDRAEDA
jgi:trk system potassium uptake protein TrkA